MSLSCCLCNWTTIHSGNFYHGRLCMQNIACAARVLDTDAHLLKTGSWEVGVKRVISIQ